MANLPDLRAINDAAANLRGFGVIPGVAQALRADVPAILETVLDEITNEVPEFKRSGNPDVLPELRGHLSDHLEQVVSLLGGSPGVDFEFVQRYAERQAGQKFPLDALLQAYRCIQKRFSVWIRDASLAAADDSAQMRRVVAAALDFGIEYVGASGPLLTSRYVEHTRTLAEAEGDRRFVLMNTLLDGYDEADARAAGLLRRAGYLEQRQSYCVAFARSVIASEMENLARAQRLGDAVNTALSTSGLRVIVGVRDQLVVAIVSGTRRQSGWTAPQSRLADQVYEQLQGVGTASIIGLSNDVPSTSDIPRAAEEARFALEFATVDERVLPFSRIPFRRMLIAQARENAKLAMPAWLNDLSVADGRARGALSKTLEAYADNDMNALKTADALGIHPNTVYARMQKIERITGRSPLKYHALTEMLLALECLRS